jgi:hypothetical protein
MDLHIDDDNENVDADNDEATHPAVLVSPRKASLMIDMN